MDSKKSSLITRQKFDDIVQHVKHPEIKIDAYFEHWIQKEWQFYITDLPGLGLKDVLVCPAKQAIVLEEPPCETLAQNCLFFLKKVRSAIEQLPAASCP